MKRRFYREASCKGRRDARNRRSAWRSCALLAGGALAFVLGGCQSPPPPARTTASAAPPPAVRPSRPALPTDLRGRPVDPFKTPAKATVLVFIGNDCPVSNRYLPTIRELDKRFAPRNVKLWLVHADPSETVEAVRKHVVEYRVSASVLRDPGHVLVKRAGASVTPEAAVFDAAGRRVYHGRIDDKFVALGKERPRALRHDLRDAVQAVLSGQPVSQPSTPAVGCYIPE